MSRYVEGFNSNQYSFFPISLDDMIDEDNPVRGISAIVDSMDESVLKFTHSSTKSTGRPPYNPISMFKMYLYCYFNGIRSSRKIERECKRNIELLWLTNGMTPDHKTIANFRKDNKKAIEAAHKEFIRIFNELKLIGKEVVAVDGTKIRADNSRRNNVTVNKLNKLIEYHEENIHEYLKQLSQNDISESTDTIKSKLKKAREQKQKYESLKTKMESEGIREKSLTDPDSCRMGVANKGTDVAYNVQNAVDAKEHIIVTTDVATNPADQTQLYAMAKKTADELNISEEEALTVLADKGYWRKDDLVKCNGDTRINAIVSVPKEQGTKGFRKSDFNYDEDKDVYICPAGNTLTRWKGKTPNYTNPKACKNCPHKDKCTKSKRGRVIQRDEHEEIMESAARQYIENYELYKIRQQLVEHPFGTLKRSLGFTYFLTRTLENVKNENFLHVMTYNLKRVLNIFRVPELVERLRTFNGENYNLKSAVLSCILLIYQKISKFSKIQMDGKTNFKAFYTV